VDNIVLGTDFITDILLVSVRAEPPMQLIPGLLETQVALRTLGEALVKAACWRLDLELGELEANYRPALTTLGQQGIDAEIYLYDTLPGGAGFCRQVGDLGCEVFELALKLLGNCDCDSSCYKCLRSYKNKFEHELLDRHVAASLLRSALYGGPPVFTDYRLDQAADMLYWALRLRGVEGVSFERSAEVSDPGVGRAVSPIVAKTADGKVHAICVSPPLTPDHVLDPGLADLKEFSVAVPVLPMNELLIRRNLPGATDDVVRWLGVPG